MDLSDFYFFKNENLKIALYYRKIGKYKLGFTYLKKACHEDQDPQAHFLMGEVYNIGGFGVSQNIPLSKRWYVSSAELGCTWAQATLSFNLDIRLTERKDFDSFTYAIMSEHLNNDLSFSYLREAVKQGNILAYRMLASFYSQPEMRNVLKQGWKLGDPACHYFYVSYKLYGDDDFEELIGMSAKQRYVHSMVQLGEMYMRKKLFSKSFYWQLKLRFPNTSTKTLLEWKRSSSDYKIGSWKFGYVSRKDPDFLRRCDYDIEGGGKSMLAFYNSGSKKIRRAIFCFIWATKGILYKDLHFIIGKIVWATRKDYQIWEKVINGGLGN